MSTLQNYIKELDEKRLEARSEYESALEISRLARNKSVRCFIDTPENIEERKRLYKEESEANAYTGEKYSIFYKANQAFLKAQFEAGAYGAYMRKCSFCEKPFYAEAQRGKYCHGGCERGAALKRKREKHKIYKQKLQEYICKCCQKQFTANRKDMKYCSNGCRQAAYRQRHVLD